MMRKSWSEFKFYPPILFILTCPPSSPHSNANLLQRSEVVALVNTLHRFSESLEAFSDFREMWAQIGSHDSEKLIRDAETSVTSTSHKVSLILTSCTFAFTDSPFQSRSSPLASSTLQHHSGILDEIRTRLEYLVEVCRDGTAECVDILRDIAKRFISFFKSSRKSDGLSMDEL